MHYSMIKGVVFGVVLSIAGCQFNEEPVKFLILITALVLVSDAYKLFNRKSRI